MALFEWLNQIDTQCFLSLNGRNNVFFDHFFTYFTCKETWYPFYLLLLLLIFRKHKMKGVGVLLIIVLAIVISDQLSVLIKDSVQRFRPSHAPGLEGLVHLTMGKRGSYGFVSSHATNSFALAFLIGRITKRKSVWFGMFLWALLVVYSRIYVGVHYPFDILSGALLGVLIGCGCYRLLRLIDFYFLAKKLKLSEAWDSRETSPLLLALSFITVTLLVVAKLSGVFQP